jgi:hypothetical protein
VVDPVAAAVGQRGQDGGQVAGGRRDLDVPGLLAGRVDHVGDPSRPEAAEAEAEVQRGADDDNQVGLLLEQAAGPEEGQLVIGREAAPAQPVEPARHPQPLGGPLPRLQCAIPVDVAPDDESRPLGPGDQRADGLDGRRIGRLARQAHTVGQLAFGRPEHVEREVEEHRAAVRRHGQRRCLVDDQPGLRRVGDGRRVLRHGGDDRHVVELLQRARAPPPLRRPPSEDDDRRTVEPRGRHGRDPVGDAGSRGQHGQARRPGELGVGLGGERRGLLVAGVDDADTLVAGGFVEGLTRARRVQREHGVDAERAERGEGLLVRRGLRSCARVPARRPRSRPSTAVLARRPIRPAAARRRRPPRRRRPAAACRAGALPAADLQPDRSWPPSRTRCGQIGRERHETAVTGCAHVHRTLIGVLGSFP